VTVGLQGVSVQRYCKLTDSEAGSVSNLILEADFSFGFKCSFLKEVMDFLRKKNNLLKVLGIFFFFFFKRNITLWTS